MELDEDVVQILATSKTIAVVGLSDSMPIIVWPGGQR